MRRIEDTPKSHLLRSQRAGLDRGGSILLALGSATLTGVGFFVENIWLWIAYVPFLLALITIHRALRVAFVMGHVSIIAAISCWGLIALGYSPWAIVPLGFVASFVIAMLYGILGVGLASTVLLAIPYLPGNPLLMAGALYPGAGFTGLGLLALGSILVAFCSRALSRIVAVVFLCLPSVFLWTLSDEAAGQYFGSVQKGHSVSALTGFEAKPIGLGKKPLSRWDIQSVLNSIPEGSTIVTGENAIKAQDRAAIRAFCRVVRVRDLTLYLGVQGADGRAQVRKFDAETCDGGTLLYTAALGIPGLTGPVLPDAGMLKIERSSKTSGPVLDFLACFEAFSIHRWAALAYHQATAVIALSNDHWTAPLPIAALRSKVSAQLARLFQIDVLHTNTAAPYIWLIREGR